MVKLLHPSVKTVGIDNNGKLVVPAAGLINSDGTAFSAGGGGGGGSNGTATGAAGGAGCVVLEY